MVCSFSNCCFRIDRRCVFLFLPAAGQHVPGDSAVDTPGIKGAYQSCELYSDNRSYRWYWNAGGFSLQFYEKCRRQSVRLATVVSELARGGLLFLPAAGAHRSGTFDRAGTLGYYHHRTASSNAVALIYVHDLLNLKYSIWARCTRGSIRLATVVSELVGVLILFLPAAGRVFNGAMGGVNTEVRWSWKDGYDYYSNATHFYAKGALGAHVRMQIRLATVVSGLVQSLSFSTLSLWRLAFLLTR